MKGIKKALELDCGEGRNAIHIAKQGVSVDAVDISEEAIKGARYNANKHAVNINFYCDSVFNLTFEKHTFDLVYDSGLFHHLLPHRRIQYI
ncbi:class I SAM-dependent methyltransferase [Paenibacillus sp. SYP-B3998]|uniref:Class I SAM-dependent methyltransferase n=1 Tax=Paenibacillus sp. SYP-B3998 TaxID=2678564 RepID=A0A6G4A4T7_9BACL|nr:class I SAM-dependent methyltransferase [Paenibacillus sp. SYP-B3998]NEW09392.1 class I SAM-dependent methyltransferase [Paenibacillus sp. SYP-B3998]